MHIGSIPWSPASWRARRAAQMPAYPDAARLAQVARGLARSVPLVGVAETRALTTALAAVGRGKTFLLQGGDCAETIDTHDPEGLRRTVGSLYDAAGILACHGEWRVMVVGRLGGQFAKPRSSACETIGTTTLPVYRGDIVNGVEFDAARRTADPTRLRAAYEHARQTCDWVSAFNDARRGGTAGPLYTSHEALLLPYEEAFVRQDAETGQFFALSAHMLWIGERTRALDGAHVEFLRGVANPVGVKCGGDMSSDEMVRMSSRLNPRNLPGRLTLITRMGAERLQTRLPALLRRSRQEGLEVVWVCDPMHGNTVSAPSGHKTRHVEAIAAEAEAFLDAHRQEGTIAGGVHLEMTGEDVSECVGIDVAEADVPRRYLSRCDPRLNPRQSQAVVARVAARLTARTEPDHGVGAAA